MRPFEGFRARKVLEITAYYDAFVAGGYPLTLEGNAETLQVARDVDRTNWLTIYGLCLEGVAAEQAATEADPEYVPNPFAIFLQTTSNAKYFMTFGEAASVIRDLRAWGLAAWGNWNALKDRARAAVQRADLDLIDITEGYP